MAVLLWKINLIIIILEYKLIPTNSSKIDIMSGKEDDKDVRKEGLRESISMWENMQANSSQVS